MKRPFMAPLFDNFFKKTPFQRYVMCAGRGRILMQRYRKFKKIRRQHRFRQDIW